MRRGGIKKTAFWLCLLFSAFSVGCVVLPMRAPTRTVTPSNLEQRTKIDLRFIQAGSTTRQEVLDKLEWTDTGYKNNAAFLGRWVSSSWVLFMAVAGASPSGGAAGAAAAPRLWGENNLLVEFDERGVVKQYRVLRDKQLVKELSAWLARAPEKPLELSSPVEIQVQHRHALGDYKEAALLLGQDSLEFRESGDDSHNFKIAPDKLGPISFAGYLKSQRDPEYAPKYTNQTIHFREKTKAGRKLTLRLDVPTLVVLLQYWRQTGP